MWSGHLKFRTGLETTLRQNFFTLRPGRLPYRTGLALQENYLTSGLPTGADLLILLSHPATITLGRSSEEKNLLSNPEQLQQAEIEVFQVARGGDTTYHGPGQVVGYPLVDLTKRGKDLHRYLRDLEEVIILCLSRWDIVAGRQSEKTGVWVDNCKIASIGVGVRRWVSWHGFALNLSSDPEGFKHIIPCGLQDVRMTSMEQLLGRAPERQSVEEALISAFSEVFNSEHAGIYDS